MNLSPMHGVIVNAKNDEDYDNLHHHREVFVHMQRKHKTPQGSAC